MCSRFRSVEAGGCCWCCFFSLSLLSYQPPSIHSHHLTHPGSWDMGIGTGIGMENVEYARYTWCREVMKAYRWMQGVPMP
ncbi:hypothetical protein F4775DRAFT_534712 [Biscogniauxia sp. FL1348]|nr:hypothetical protein F4775DRAFT_534712 [Biscogniauxia sp. FL1348]